MARLPQQAACPAWFLLDHYSALVGPSPPLSAPVCGGMLLSARLQASFNITNSLHYTRCLSATAAVPHNITPLMEQPKTTQTLYEGFKENHVGFIGAFNKILTTCVNHLLQLYIAKFGHSYLNLKLFMLQC